MGNGTPDTGHAEQHAYRLNLIDLVLRGSRTQSRAEGYRPHSIAVLGIEPALCGLDEALTMKSVIGRLLILAEWSSSPDPEAGGIPPERLFWDELRTVMIGLAATGLGANPALRPTVRPTTPHVEQPRGQRPGWLEG
jgi:hypothetical protein